MAGESAGPGGGVVKALMAILGAVQVLIFWWGFDQTVRLRAVELDLATMKSASAAAQPFANQDRATLTSLQQTVSKQDQIMEKTVGVVRELSDVVQGMAKAQIEFRISIDRLEQRQIERLQQQKR